MSNCAHFVLFRATYSQIWAKLLPSYSQQCFPSCAQMSPNCAEFLALTQLFMGSRCYQNVKCPKSEEKHNMPIQDIVYIRCSAIDGVKNVVAPNGSPSQSSPICSDSQFLPVMNRRSLILAVNDKLYYSQ